MAENPGPQIGAVADKRQQVVHGFRRQAPACQAAVDIGLGQRQRARQRKALAFKRGKFRLDQCRPVLVDREQPDKEQHQRKHHDGHDAGAQTAQAEAQSDKRPADGSPPENPSDP